MMKRNILFIGILLFALQLSAQAPQVIEIRNASFEDIPREGSDGVNTLKIRSWTDCGFANETPPDIHPVVRGNFRVVNDASHGDTYLGMVVRDNETYEGLSQRLQQPLVGGNCYVLNVKLARSLDYHSRSRYTDKNANYITPATFRVWAGNGYCDRKELLHTTREVIHTRWINYTMELKPSDNYQFLIIEVFYKTPVLFPYNGNILVDDLSPIRQISCDGGPLALVEEEEEETKLTQVIKDPPPTTPVTPAPPVVTTPDPPVTQTNTPKKQGSATKKQEKQKKPDKPLTIGKIAKEEMKMGDIFRIDRIFFEVDKSELRSESFESLDKLADFLLYYEDVIIELGGHTNGLCDEVFCDQLSLARAQAVGDYLIGRGVSELQLEYKGYGKRKPVATNRTSTGQRTNQRVEIKLLRIENG